MIDSTDALLRDAAQGFPSMNGNSQSPEIPQEFHVTDQGNAQRLVARHGADLHYCYIHKAWYVWDGIRFKPDNTGELTRRAKETGLSIYGEAAIHPDEEQRKRLGKWAVSSESLQRIGAMIDLARSEQGIPVMPEELDSDPWLLNCPNGTVDLKTGHLRAHRHEDLITKVTAAEYHPDAGYGLWDEFLARCLPDSEQRSFVQRAMGYSATGLSIEELLFFPYGPTATGKSTLLKAVRSALGNYATVADFSTFLERKQQGPRNDVAALAGKRLVMSVEVDQGEKLAEGLVNTLTGGDPIRARFLFQESFEFEPTFTLWLAANHRPRVRHDSDASWRRIVQVPFDQQIPEAERDPGVKAMLCDPAVAGPAVLAWIVKGCLDWQDIGLQIPDSVRQATAEYRTEMDPLTEFLEECCVLGPETRASNSDVWTAYQQWAKENSVRYPLGRKGFSQRLVGLEGVSLVNSGGRYWTGIGLTAEEKLF